MVADVVFIYFSLLYERDVDKEREKKEMRSRFGFNPI